MTRERAHTVARKLATAVNETTAKFVETLAADERTVVELFDATLMPYNGCYAVATDTEPGYPIAFVYFNEEEEQ